MALERVHILNPTDTRKCLEKSLETSNVDFGNRKHTIIFKSIRETVLITDELCLKLPASFKTTDHKHSRNCQILFLICKADLKSLLVHGQSIECYKGNLRINICETQSSVTKK